MTTRYHKFPRFFKSSSFLSNSKQSRTKSYASSIPSSDISRPDDLAGLLHATRSKKCLRRLHARLAVMGAMRDASVVAGAVERYLFFGSPASAAAVFAGAYRRRPEVYCLNIVVRCFSDYGFHEKLLGLYRKVLGFGSNKYTFPPVIKACAAVSCVRLGKEVHCKVLRTGHGDSVGVQTAILDMYAKTGQTDLSRRVFDGMTRRDLVSWNAMIAGYSLNGCLREAVEALKHLQQDGFRPDASSLVGVVSVSRGLGAMDLGVSLHAFALKSGVLGDESLTPAFISMYDLFGHLPSCLLLFHQSSVNNLVSCNSMISACMQRGVWKEAFEVFRLMHCTGLQPDLVTVISILPCCSNFFGISLGESVHGMIIKFGLAEQVSVVRALVSMYSKLEELDSAVFLFYSQTRKSQLLWNSLISGYLVNNKWKMVLDSLRKMQNEGVVPDALTVINMIWACRHTKDLQVAKSIHAYAVRKRFQLNECVMNSLLAMYADCGELSTSYKLFQKMEVPMLISWNTIISGFSENGDTVACLRLFCQMRLAGLQFDLVTLISLISSLSAAEDTKIGESVHSLAVKSGCSLDVPVANALITMYTNCGIIQAGERLFDSLSSRNAISYNALMTGYRKNNLSGKILPLFHEMIRNDEKPNIVTLLNLLPICQNQLQGKTAHSYAIRNLFKLETSLFASVICMYTRFSNIEYCHKVFNLVGQRNIIEWNSILSACVHCKQAVAAFDYFRQMQFLDVKNDEVTIVAIISAISQLGKTDLAECVMAHTLQKGFDGSTIVFNALIDMHSRCGNISFARKLFDSLMERDSISWSTMINAYSMHGDGGSALDLFLTMVASGVKPNDITFVSILSACSHSGFLEQGRALFVSLHTDHGITPKMEHYACMVDLLGRTGHLDEAYDIVTTMPLRPSESLLVSLLGACQKGIAVPLSVDESMEPSSDSTTVPPSEENTRSTSETYVQPQHTSLHNIQDDAFCSDSVKATNEIPSSLPTKVKEKKPHLLHQMHEHQLSLRDTWQKVPAPLDRSDRGKYLRTDNTFVDTTTPIESVKESRHVILELDRLKKEISECKWQAEAAEAAKVSLSNKYEKTKKLIEELEHQLERAQPEELCTMKDLEFVQFIVQETEEGVTSDDSVTGREKLNIIKEQYNAVLSKLMLVKDESRKVQENYETLLIERDISVRKAQVALAMANDTMRNVKELTVELNKLKAELELAHSTCHDAEKHSIGTSLVRNEDCLTWESDLRQAEEELNQLVKKLSSVEELKSMLDASSGLLLKVNNDLAAYMEAKLTKEAQGKVTQRSMHNEVVLPTTEVEKCRMRVDKVRDEVHALNVAAASLKTELAKEKGALATMQQMEAMSSITAASLKVEIQLAQQELDAVQAKEKESRNGMLEFQKIMEDTAQEADKTKSIATEAQEQLRKAKEDMEHAKTCLNTVEFRLQEVLKKMEATKESERLALDALRSLESELPINTEEQGSQMLTLDLDEYQSLVQKSHQAEELVHQRTAAAVAQVKMAKESESCSLSRLNETYKVLQQRKQALLAATERANKATEGKLAMERELRKWREEHMQRRRAGEASKSELKPSNTSHIAIVKHRGDTKGSSKQDGNPTVHPLSDISARSSPNASPLLDKTKKTKILSFFPRIVMFFTRRRLRAVE
ncbi:hypothetical protein ABZP36_020778 [Zizania latifolia]